MAEIPPSSRLVSLRNAFFSGVILLAPLVVTIWALSKIIDVVGGTFRPLFFFYLPERWSDQRSLVILWDILATGMVVVAVALLGTISRYVFGKYFLSIGARLIQGIPGVGAIYNSVKQVVDTFGQQNRTLFNQTVLVEFPRKGSWVLGFVTSKTQGEAQTRTGEEVWTVFVPTAPNPTSGFILMIPVRDIVPLEMSVGDGMKLVISGGAVIPAWRNPAVAAEPVLR